METVERDQQMTAEEVLGNYYALSSTEKADIGDGAGMEQIEVYTGNIGDGESGVVLFKDADGTVLGSEFAHAARAGWNNILEVEEIRQIAGSRFEFGENLRYADEMFHAWADDLSFYLANSHLLLSSQDGEIRTEKVSEADRYNYETLRREP